MTMKKMLSEIEYRFWKLVIFMYHNCTKVWDKIQSRQLKRRIAKGEKATWTDVLDTMDEYKDQLKRTRKLKQLAEKREHAWLKRYDK